MDRVSLMSVLVMSAAIATSAGCEKKTATTPSTTAETPAASETVMAKLINSNAEKMSSSGKDICVKIAKRLRIYADNELYDDAGFEQTFKTYLDIGVKEGCMPDGQGIRQVAEPTPPPPPVQTVTYVKMGGYLCNTAGAVMGERGMRYQAQLVFRGCEQVGADVEVNVLGREASFGAVKVGNSGGVAWVDEQDLSQR